jgi:hypothetical protein
MSTISICYILSFDILGLEKSEVPRLKRNYLCTYIATSVHFVYYIEETFLASQKNTVTLHNSTSSSGIHFYCKQLNRII